MRSPDIEFVYFDAANTLLNLNGIDQRLRELSGKDPEQIKKAWLKVNEKAEIGRIDRDQASELLAELLGIEHPFDAENYVFRLSRNAVTLMHRNMILLAASGVGVGIASNAWDKMVETSIDDEHLPNIPGMVVWTSAKAGVAKPSCRAWQSMTKMAGYKYPSKIMLVDDARENIISARKYGFGEVFKVDPTDYTGSAMLLHARLVELGLLG